FLWKSLHNAHKIGYYWTHIPECEERAVCRTCGTEENLEHILTECESPGPEIVWKEVESLWARKNELWPPLSLGGILGSGLAKFHTRDGKEDEGAERLQARTSLRGILMSEAAYLIWRLRNERVITRDGRCPFPEIVNRWNNHINYRLQVDITLGNCQPDGKKPVLAPKKVLETWSGTLDNEGSMPANWLREPRVL
ncbi:hypothetical protein B0H19DRAFT_874688, partial [Mycena capillaripes]